jgi:hypothetical protein
MIARLLSGILAVVFLPLGLAFLGVGLFVEDVDSGSPAGFARLGAACAVAGVGFALVFALLMRKEAKRRERRRAGLRASVEVLASEVRHGVQSNRKRGLRLTVRGPSGEPLSGQLLALPEAAPAAGDRIEILYDPAEPENFEPA